MSGVTHPDSSLSITVVLTGHLIDSLTLSKVIDLVQHHGGDYELNDIQIGSAKKDISSVSMTINAPDSVTFNQILDELKPYGAILATECNALLTPASSTHEQAFQLKLPSHVRYQDKWLPIESRATGMLLVVNPDKNTARLARPEDCQPEEQIVLGHQGIKWEEA